MDRQADPLQKEKAPLPDRERGFRKLPREAPAQLFIAALTTSGVIGSERTRAPTAL